jgi:glycosyltransferase involved in cell wall biosynthesis
VRIVHIIDSIASGGKERQLCELAKGLVGTPDVALSVVVLSDVVQYGALSELGVPIHVLRRTGGASLTDFVRVLNTLKQLGPDVVHSWNSMCSVYGAPAAMRCGAGFVNGFFRSAPARLSWGLRMRTLLTQPLSDVAVANSRAGLAAFHLAPRKSVCIYNGFDEARLANMPPPEEVRRSLGIRTHNVVGMVGAFSPFKDYRSYLDVAAGMTRSRPDVTFLAVGAGPELEALQREFPSTDYPRIRFLGRRSDVEAIASVLTVGVLATHTEGISNSIMEYMAVGKPVVATDCPGNRELVEDGRSGFLVGESDPAALRGRIDQLLDNPELAARLGARGRTRITEDFSLEAMTNAYLALYRRVIDKRAGKISQAQ